MSSHATDHSGTDHRSGDHQHWRENRAVRGWRALDLRDLWQYRELLWFLAVRDVRVRYKQAILGGAWAILRPVIGALVFLLIFRHVAHVNSDGIDYLPFAYVSFAAWACMSSGLISAMASLVDNAQLVTKVYFPRVLAPAAAVLPPLLDFVVSLVLVPVLLVATDTVPGWPIVLLPVFVVLLAVVPFAFGLWLCTLNVQYRDVGYIANLLLQVWLFLSPVAYGLTMIEPKWRALYAINPAVGVLGGLRWSLLGGPWPGWPFAVSMAALTVVLVSGLGYFLRVERRFADVI
jgi:ABC-type polysaccharide/polyol phosphate export permease